MPRPQASPRVSPVPISALLVELTRFRENETEVRAEYPWANRFVMGLPLPPWQRDFVWTEAQCRRFITSAWTGVSLGQYTLTEFDLARGDDVRYVRLTNCVMDGQQRLRALELYFSDALEVEDADGILTKWSDLVLQEQRWFANRIFDRGIVRESDETKLRQYYDAWNFGGTPHQEHERAIPLT